jgi:hypothetical protein
MLWFWIAYIIVTLIGIIHTCFNWLVLKMENDKSKPIKSMYDIVPYAKTIPYHPLYNIIVWPIFAFIYYNMVNPENLWLEALIIAITWCLVTIIVDVIAWVLIKHPWSMTWKEMYLDYQPWLTLIYLSIFVSPFIGAIFWGM